LGLYFFRIHNQSACQIIPLTDAKYTYYYDKIKGLHIFAKNL